ncbi:hypothetical protein [Neisseria macacae]|uniref:Uncharacterized protein n=1 Tax=Neisseria macacae ATCC 33926 TaxID=997348 RepID=A0AA36UIZ8_9NEIS|nr:hypothetical protein [Neisseria macacae]EGQ76608.1 hypothetical protein HMPREF9418_1704 [Neisseria macacae ATCC 33926]
MKGHLKISDDLSNKSCYDACVSACHVNDPQPMIAKSLRGQALRELLQK